LSTWLVAAIERELMMNAFYGDCGSLLV